MAVIRLAEQQQTVLVFRTSTESVANQPTGRAGRRQKLRKPLQKRLQQHVNSGCEQLEQQRVRSVATVEGV